MGVALHGNIRDFGLAEVFQLIGQQRKTGVLEISRGRSRMCLAFSEGAVVRGSPDGVDEYAALGEMLVRCGLLPRERLEELSREARSSARPLGTVLVESGALRPADLDEVSDLVTRETLFEVLRWSDGSFHFSARPVPHDLPPERLLGAEQILMDGLRMVDEWNTFSAEVPSGDTVFERTDPITSDAALGRQPAAERLLHLIDGRLPARRVIDLSRLGTFEGTRWLAELRRAGFIAPVDVERAVRAARAERPRVAWGAALQRVASALLPVALLAGMTALLLGQIPGLELPRLAPPPVYVGVPVPRTPIRDARESYEARRLRHAAESHWALTGAWPESLESLAESRARGTGSLAGAPERSYYYAQRGHGIILLPPSR